MEEFTEHINSIYTHIKFTIKKGENGTLTFTDTNPFRGADGSLKTTVFRKATHNYQYLDFKSAHPVEHKLEVVRALNQRAEIVTLNTNNLKLEQQYVNKALRLCMYPNWAMK